VAAKWQAHWDERNLYLSISVNDGHVETGDGVEVVIEAEGQRNELSIMFSEDVEASTLFTEIDSGYYITSVIPWKDLKGDPEPEESEKTESDEKVAEKSKSKSKSEATKDESEEAAPIAKVVPESGSSIYFDIQIKDVDKEREKKPLYFADRVDSKAGDRKLITSVVKGAKKLGHKEVGIENHLKQVVLVD
jgi:hypothetical protein